MAFHVRNIRCIRASAAIFLPILAHSTLAYSQSLLAWDRLKQLSPGDEIRVQLSDRGAIQAEFESVTSSSLVISSPRGPETIAAQNVARISTKRRAHRGRNALIGLGIGAGVGLGVGAAIDAEACHMCLGPRFPNIGKAILTPLGGIVGGVIGVLLPTGGWQEVYRRP